MRPGPGRLTQGDASLARTIAIIRGTSAHVAQPVPDKFFDSGDVDVEEFLPGSRRPAKRSAPSSPSSSIVDFAAGDALAPYVPDDVVRILSAGTYFARVATSTRPPASLVLDVALPAVCTPGWRSPGCCPVAGSPPTRR